MSNFNRYSDQEIADFLEVAVDIGIGRAIRELGYPKSWMTAKRWADMRNIDVEVNAMKAKAKSYDLWYTDRDVLLGAEAGMARVMESLEEEDLSADDKKKLAESYQKFANIWLTVQGKANNITQTQRKDGMDLEIVNLLNNEIARNESIESQVETVESETE